VARTDTIVVARFVFADPAAHSVAVMGDFNRWDASATPMAHSSAGSPWVATLKLKPGRYEYAFLVDGKRWVTDHATRASRDQFDSQSSVFTLAGASTPATEMPATARIKKLLQRATAEKVVSTISTARSQGLPASVLENHALKYVAEHVAAKEIERAIAGEAAHMTRANALLASTERREPTTDEIAAGAELLARDGDSTSIPAVARSAAATRSLAVPLRVSAELIASNVSPRDAVTRVVEKLRAGASDAQLERLVDDAATHAVAKAKAKPKTPQVAKSTKSANVQQAGSPTKPKPAKKKTS
jgi:hypothetical protein